jgi:hypothetical protein
MQNTITTVDSQHWKLDFSIYFRPLLLFGLFDLPHNFSKRTLKRLRFGGGSANGKSISVEVGDVTLLSTHNRWRLRDVSSIMTVFWIYSCTIKLLNSNWDFWLLYAQGMRVRNTYSGPLISSRRHRTVSVLMLLPKEIVEDPHWLFYLRGGRRRWYSRDRPPFRHDDLGSWFVWLYHGNLREALQCRRR